ncbi:hypothetical protein K3N28_08585 [Glycomyces sp. TRM65418]|uniref:hypothetical protein n=1 Tax=Glycomyces sp. TRM65418 TaxID=2867006 RepID=UPI001CE7000C|nr:hypothetical protein [Glycomyces sp. TRM65418]MCC3763125.1 hypothetical protein [Glycomyces sp. TRM65418]QZD57132.1 hypothetical protein K3N28_08525 [Glycomyces sp. TRM65418]
MQTLHHAAFAAAERYLILNARLIDRARFAYRFHDGPVSPVLHAVRAYQNPDGGFGSAIEPDLRGTGSQPQGVETALWALDDVGAFDEAIVLSACAWLEANSTEEGGVPWVLPSVVDDERAPWWQPQGESPPAALNPTAPVVGLLHAHGVAHPWIGPATEFCWRTIAELTEIEAYDARCVLAFLERVPDRERAEAEFRRLREPLRAAAAIDPDAEGHVHTPLDLAPRPEALGRALFSDDEIDLHLDVLIDAQNEDGGWAPNFPMWTPVVAHEWGGHLTAANLRTLKAYGRIA